MQVPVEDLIKGMIVQSGNDATVALAEGVGGTVEHFVELMNEQAKALGMKTTSYQNPEGLTEAGPHHHGARPEHPGDAADPGLSRVRELLHDQEVPLRGHAHGQRHQPQHAAVSRSDGRRPEDRPHRRRRLLHDRHRQARLPEPVGARRLLAIVLGATSENARANEAQKLLNWGYTAYEAVKLFDANQAVVDARGLEGHAENRQAGPAPGGRGGRAGRHRHADQDPGGPARPAGRAPDQGPARRHPQGQRGRPAAARRALVALETVEQAGVLSRAWDAVRLWIK